MPGAVVRDLPSTDRWRVETTEGGAAMETEPDRTRSTAELLAEWRAAGRDTVAARAASRVAKLALEAAIAAEHAATEVQAAAQTALESVDRARAAALKAREAARETAEAAATVLAAAEGDKVRADRDVELTELAESVARDAFHVAEDEAHRNVDQDAG